MLAAQAAGASRAGDVLLPTQPTAARADSPTRECRMSMLTCRPNAPWISQPACGLLGRPKLPCAATRQDLNSDFIQTAAARSSRGLINSAILNLNSVTARPVHAAITLVSAVINSPPRRLTKWVYIEGSGLVPHRRGPDGRWCSRHVGPRRPCRIRTPVSRNSPQSTAYLPAPGSTPLVPPLLWGTCHSRRRPHRTAARWS